MKKRMWMLIGIAAVLFVGLPQSAKGDNRRALAEELMNVRHVQQTLEETMVATKQMMKKMIPAQMKNAGVNVSASAVAAQEKTTNAIMNLVTDEMSWDKIKNGFISIYANTYTEEELRGQIDFYKSPVGQAVVSKEPELMKKTMEMQQTRMMELMPRIMAITKEAAAGALAASPPTPATPPAPAPAQPPVQP